MNPYTLTADQQIRLQVLSQFTDRLDFGDTCFKVALAELAEWVISGRVISTVEKS